MDRFVHFFDNGVTKKCFWDAQDNRFGNDVRCSVPISKLVDEPFNLQVGDTFSYKAKAKSGEWPWSPERSFPIDWRSDTVTKLMF